MTRDAAARACVVVIVLGAVSVYAQLRTSDGGVADPDAAFERPTLPERVANPAALERYRTPMEVLTERFIGEASRAVRFDWRRTTLGFGVVASQVLELNNFASGRIGAFARTPLGSGFSGELAVTWAFTAPSDSSYKLSLTPYRQVGRPSRLEVDLNLAYALVEGVVTPRFSFMPPMEMVFSLDAGLRYLYYPGVFSHMIAGDVFKSLFAPIMSDVEIANLDEWRLPGMQIDRARYSVLVGVSLDVYFQNGIFFTPRVLVGLPVFSLAAGGGLGFWWELSLSLGWAF